MTSPLEDYLARLEDLLPPAEAARALPEIEGMILDRADAEREADPTIDDAEAQRRALTRWDDPETIVESLVRAPLTIDTATRRSFLRTWAAVFVGHLVLSVVLTLAGSKGEVVPGLLGPLPTDSFLATAAGVLALLLLDTGAVFLLFLFLGKGRARARLPHLDLQTRWSRRDALKGLVLVGLLGVIFNGFLDTIFAIRTGDELVPILSPDVTALVPLVNIVLALFAVRFLLTLAGRGGQPEAAAADALGSLGAAVVLMLAATRSDIVRVPEKTLGPGVSDAFGSALERVLLLIFVVGALFLALRFVKQGLRTIRLVQARNA